MKQSKGLDDETRPRWWVLDESWQPCSLMNVPSVYERIQFNFQHSLCFVTFNGVITFSDVNLNNGVSWRPTQQVYIKHVKIVDFYLFHETNKGVWNKIC